MSSKLRVGEPTIFIDFNKDRGWGNMIKVTKIHKRDFLFWNRYIGYVEMMKVLKLVWFQGVHKMKPVQGYNQFTHKQEREVTLNSRRLRRSSKFPVVREQAGEMTTLKKSDKR